MIRIALVLSLVAFGAPVSADDTLWLARLCVGESGFNAPETCRAQVHLIVRRAERSGVSPAAHARAYSRALRRPPRGREWVRHLRPVGAPHSSWRRSSLWPRFRARFAKHVMRWVREALTGGRPDPCKLDEPMHFGGPMDAHRFDDKPGWRRCCGALDRHLRRRQLFWCPE